MEGLNIFIKNFWLIIVFAIHLQDTLILRKLSLILNVQIMGYIDFVDSMLVMIFGCWWRWEHLLVTLGTSFGYCCPTRGKKQPKATLLSQCCRHNISSPISVTNIVVAKSWWYLYNYCFIHIKYLYISNNMQTCTNESASTWLAKKTNSIHDFIMLLLSFYLMLMF